MKISRMLMCSFLMLLLAATTARANLFSNFDLLNERVKELLDNLKSFVEDIMENADLLYDRCEVPQSQPANNDTDGGRLINFALKRCQYRDRLLLELFFKWYTGHGCYTFSQPALFKPGVPRAVVGACRHNSSLESLLVPCFVLPKQDATACYPIDSAIPQVVAEIQRMMVNSVGVNKWIRCTEAAVDCCKSVMDDENVKPNEERCTAVWDGWKCWAPVPAGNVSEAMCPEFAYSNSGPSCNHFGTKTCFANGTWNAQSDYTTCGVTARLLTRVRLHVGFLATTVALSAPAALVMFAYRRLRALHRLALHRNLLVAIVLRCAIMIVTKAVILTDELTFSPDKADSTIMDRNQFPCKLLTVLEKTASSAVFTCMLVDGVFMHRRIVSIFKEDLSVPIVYSVAAVATLVPVAIWTIIMALYNDHNCWLVYTIPHIQWSLDGPRLLMLCVNVVLLVDILRIIVTKMNRKENAQQLSTTKATIFLMPVFGVQFVFTAYKPNFDSCYWEQWYFTCVYLLESLQGILVAVFYCYANKEVHRLVRATYERTGAAVSKKLQASSTAVASAHQRLRRPTTLNVRRGTMSTAVTTTSTVSPDATPSSAQPVLVRFSHDGASDDVLGDLRNSAGRQVYSPAEDCLANVGFEHDDDRNGARW